MNFKEAMIKAMTSRGMFDSQAREVMDNYMFINSGADMMDRWHEDVNGYPEALQNILWSGVKVYAAEWIKENTPQAWFRPMFEYSETELTKMMNSK